ncbi:hypothetical protein [Hymenobacter sp. YC55]|uniref:hypothetical protein n=1 Tax=Hymenobacter sp. YC55 TaxID=3034019 RepID=UPI0023F9BF4B|nr:hypothetical protein [Hymenobacter sp. YC55]MDF7813758.1 hypothetical protein [Hymenobacter sp. YC55]
MPERVSLSCSLWIASSAPVTPSATAAAASGAVLHVATPAGVLIALDIVYGDIGTTPLYALRAILSFYALLRRQPAKWLYLPGWPRQQQRDQRKLAPCHSRAPGAATRAQAAASPLRNSTM